MNYWLVKTEPGNYSIQNLEKDGTCVWDGVRNYQARNFLMQMKVGDTALIYHSVHGKEIVGQSLITSEYYPDPTDESKKFMCVDMKFISKFTKPYSLDMVKTNPKLSELRLLKQSRLSVMPVSQSEYDEILKHV
ncbi:MAG: EVE domain-containing protein [Alphaproteobacteria bacterium]|jgi:predicted RNA-binding protein with PUA-like domain|nr:EVE domain-containing protein [Candidatus Jidaibacter sp.]